jgi:integrase/recombinase XerC
VARRRARDSDALADPFARDYAVRDFKRHLKLERRWSPASVNLALAAVDHFLRFVGVGAAEVSRERLPQAAPRALEGDELLAFVRAAGRAAARDRAIGLLLACAGLRLSELVALDLDDARVSGRKAVVGGSARARVICAGRCRSTRRHAERLTSG